VPLIAFFLINAPSRFSLRDVTTDTFIYSFFRGFKYSYRHLVSNIPNFCHSVSHPHKTKGRETVRNDSTDCQLIDIVLAKRVARVSLNVTSRKKGKTLSHSGEGNGHLKIK